MRDIPAPRDITPGQENLSRNLRKPPAPLHPNHFRSDEPYYWISLGKFREYLKRVKRRERRPR
jgi:hypothetical protein